MGPDLRVLSLVSNQTLMGAGKVVMEFCSQASAFGVACLPVCIVRGAKETNEYAEALRLVGIPREHIYERRRFDPRSLLQLARIVRRFRPHVVETHGHRETLYALALRPFFRFRPVVYFHGWSATSRWTHEGNPCSALFLRLSPVLITVCRDFKARLCRQGVPASQIHVFYNGVNPDLCRAMPTTRDLREQLGVGEKDRLIAVIGRLSREKGQADFLRAFALVARRHSNVRALVVGDGPDMAELRQLADRLSLGSKVIFTGYRQDVRTFYETIDVLVVPSLSEGIPNVVLEAMVFGVPVVSTQVGGIPEMIADGRTGILVPPEDPGQLADAICRLAEDPALGRRLAEQARKETLAVFSTRERSEKVTRFYRKLIEGE